MTPKRIPISIQGHEKIKQELKDLKKERPVVIQAIKEAREEGDLKENAGYDAARERQGMLEAKISHIESRMPLFEAIDLDTQGGEKVVFGATVELEDQETGDIKNYTLLGPDEADFQNGSISIHSPVGRALVGKMVDDEVVVNVPKGRVEYVVLSVEFHGAGGPPKG